MSYLGRIEAKLDELVRAKKSEEAEKQPTQEEKDEQRLREIEERVTDLIELLNEGTTREAADDKIGHARERVKSGKGEPRPLLKVYHEHKGKKISTTRRTQVSVDCESFSWLPGEVSVDRESFLWLAGEVALVSCVWLYHCAYMPDSAMNFIFMVFVFPHVALFLAGWLGLHLFIYAWALALKYLFGERRAS